MIIIYIIGGIIGIFLAVIALQPNNFRVTRSLSMSAPPSAIFPHVNNLHNFNEWNPWAAIDPHANNVFEGASEGVGAVMRWEGNNKVGSGSMINTQSRQNEFIQFKMEFIKPMQATHIAEFTFTPQGEQTTVTWSMYGSNNFMGKALGLIMNCDKMIGDQFEKGLLNLKAIIEKK
ncbi:MAG: SRPBCC family protein [Alphaproteobacteria bacterium]